MLRQRPLVITALAGLLSASLVAHAQELIRVLPADAAADPRLRNVRSLYQGSNFQPVADKEQWEQRAREIREQVLIAAGLWPLPEKTPLNPVIHTPIDRGDYTVEKVFFQSYPGFYVTGNLYRPKGKTGPFPGVLCPHGHWANGRFYRTSDREVERQLKAGEEKDPDAARYPLQARCANLAKLGCIVFHYDMVGYADADPENFPHRATFTDFESDLHSLNMLGLQTWNSVRSIDLLLSLPDIDASRIACTGASGGGTQTFILMVIEDRLKVAAPVCMISHDNHQGGCVCENASHLRFGTDNVEFAATFAPRPFIHPTATGDWTKEFLERGLPEIRAIYRLFDAEQGAQAVRFDAGHNYNLNSREAVYNFFNKHLRLGKATPVREQKFMPIEPQELSVFDDQHPRPADSVDAAGLRKYLIDSAAKRLEALRPADAQSLERFRQVIGPALRHLVHSQLPAAGEVTIQKMGELASPQLKGEKLLLSRSDSAERLPALLFVPARPTGAATLIIHPRGKAGLLNGDGAPDALVSALLEKGQMVLAPDIFLIGELAGTMPESAQKIEFIPGYNRTTLGNRVHDILTSIACLKSRPGVISVNLIGLESAGPATLLARALASDSVARTAADVNGFDFRRIESASDENFVPGALRFGGLWTLTSLAAPAELHIYDIGADAPPSWLASVYAAAGATERLRILPSATAGQLVDWIAP